MIERRRGELECDIKREETDCYRERVTERGGRETEREECVV